MEFTNEVIGGRLIETITSGLYDGNLNCLREYVQNSIDSKAKNIEIFFENGNHDLVIKDDGSGMSQEELMKSLSIGRSDKTEEETGWRGIGIWSGVPACKRIAVITKKRNNEKFRVEIYNDELRNEIGTNKPILEVLTNSTGDIEELPIGKDDSFENDQFTIVRLESILPPQKNIFSEQAITNYLSRTVPAPFNEKQFLFATQINEWLKQNNINLPSANITFQGKRIFRPPFKSDIFFDNLIKNEFRVNDELIGIGWFLTTNENRKLKEPNRGIYFKKKGFTIGDENLVRNQFSGTYNPWQYGEIHIVSKKLRENAARNAFEYNNGFVYTFLEDVGKFIGQLQMQNRYQSNKIVSKRINTLQKYIGTGNLPSAKKEIDKINKRLAEPSSFPTDPSLKKMKMRIDNISEKNKNEVTEIETKIKTKKPEDIKNKREQIDAFIDNLPFNVKKSIRRATKKGQLHPEMSVTDAIKEILKEKTGLDNNEIIELSQAAYGWADVTSRDDPPILCIDKNKLPRNLRLGVMIYTIHDIFVNLAKHEKGKSSFKWFEDISDEEKYALLTEMYAVIGLAYRLIEKSEKCQP